MTITIPVSGIAQLRSLVQLISEGVEDIIAQYSKVDQDVPTLDYLGVSHYDKSENYNEHLTDAIKIVEGACAQLSLTVANPSHSIANKAFSFFEPATLKVVHAAKIADILDCNSEGVHLDEIAKKSKLEKGKLARILRFLGTRHVFREVSPDVFTNNRLSIKLRSVDPVGAFVGHQTDEIMIGSTHLYDALSDPVSGHSTLTAHAAFTKAFGLHVWDYYISPGGRTRGERFNKAMIGWSLVCDSDCITNAFPWADLPADTTICDVAGGNGSAMNLILKAYPHLRAVIQDLGPVIEDAKKFWNTENREAVASNRVELSTIDFFKESPKKGCDIYFLRCIIHDWPDAASVDILRNIRKVMSPNSRVLIQEFTLPSLVRQNDPAIKEAPEPLLPNYGLGKIKIGNIDLNMLSSLNSKERTLPEFISIGKQAGLKFVKVYKCVDMDIMEFVPTNPS